MKSGEDAQNFELMRVSLRHLQKESSMARLPVSMYMQHILNQCMHQQHLKSVILTLHQKY